MLNISKFQRYGQQYIRIKIGETTSEWSLRVKVEESEMAYNTIFSRSQAEFWAAYSQGKTLTAQELKEILTKPPIKQLNDIERLVSYVGRQDYANSTKTSWMKVISLYKELYNGCEETFFLDLEKRIGNVCAVQSFNRVKKVLGWKYIPKRDKKSTSGVKYLNEEQLRSLESYEPENKWEFMAKDAFILMANTGMAYVDAFKYNLSWVIDGFIEYKRQKSGVIATVPYLGYDPINLPGDKSIINKSLSAIGRKLGFKISTHMGRHTFATTMLTKGYSVEAVAKMLGHKTTVNTSIYAQVTKNKLRREFDLLQ